jgi:hypothetical protein
MSGQLGNINWHMSQSLKSPVSKRLVIVILEFIGCVVITVAQ